MEEQVKSVCEELYWKDGKMCWGITLDEKMLVEYLQIQPTFLIEPIEAVINLSCMNCAVMVPANDTIVAPAYAREGWTVSHMMVYSRSRVVKPLLERGFFKPVKDGLGRKLSDMSAVYEAKFPFYWQPFQDKYPATFAYLKQIEFNHDQKRKIMLLLCCGGISPKKQIEEVVDCHVTPNGKQFNNHLPRELLMIVGEFLFNCATREGTIINEFKARPYMFYQ